RTRDDASRDRSDLLSAFVDPRARSSVARTGRIRLNLSEDGSLGGVGYRTRNKKLSPDDLKVLVQKRLEAFETELGSWSLLETFGLTSDTVRSPFERFRSTIIDNASNDESRRWGATFRRARVTEQNVPKLEELQRIYNDRGVDGLDTQLRYAFFSYLSNSSASRTDIDNQKALADLRYPTEWFPATRKYQRTIHLHVGPTNSGKTYHALKQLEEATSGIYAGPLRLLAHEVFTRLNAKGRKCGLMTGEELRFPNDDPSDTPMRSCTVEMVPLNKQMEVAVIDEIQMIGDSHRGWAWTQALLGIQASEVHLCGEARTVPLVRELTAAMGDKLEIHRYERLSPLHMASGSLKGDLSQLRKGDCIVSFSVMGIHALRKEIEKKTGKKVAIVYGSLPPETRAQQARLFNDPDNEYDFLVASDAIGMGLNLSIKRIIFETTQKFNGNTWTTLKVSEIKQIAGRAGRYRTAEQDVREQEKTDKDGPAATPSPATGSSNMGFVTTLEEFDYPIVEKAMEIEPDPIRTAGLFPPAAIVERFTSYFPPGTPFSYILLRLNEITQIHSRFHMCELKDQLMIADVIQPIKDLTTTDRIILCASPASVREKKLENLL
ncbi:hypothetical protein LTS18_010344, partial [Coniosporium uncinatum]